MSEGKMNSKLTPEELISLRYATDMRKLPNMLCSDVFFADGILMVGVSTYYLANTVLTKYISI